jgi:hypothetical protein
MGQFFYFKYLIALNLHYSEERKTAQSLSVKALGGFTYMVPMVSQ